MRLTPLPGTALVLLLAVTPALTQREGPAVGTGLIVGQIVDGGTGKPMPGAVVSIAGPARSAPRVLTGPRGYFVFRDLPRGAYTISASKPGYVEGAFGQRRASGTPQTIALGDGERMGDAIVRLWRHGAISGVVSDEAGDRLAGVQVCAWSREIGTGRTTISMSAVALTDDRGIFRLGGLRPGSYLVGTSATNVAVPVTAPRDVIPPQPVLRFQDFLYWMAPGTITPPPPGERLFLYQPVFYPGSNDPGGATLVTLGPAEERDGVSLQAHPSPTARLAGKLTAPGEAPSGLVLRLIPRGFDDASLPGQGATTITALDGSFVFLAVTPGDYTLRATTGLRIAAGMGIQTLWVREPIVVGGADLDGLVIPMYPAMKISGRLEFEGGKAPPSEADVARIPIAIESADGESQPFPLPTVRPTAVRGAGQADFEATGLAGGRYVARVTDSPTGWMFKSADYGGRDISSSPLELTGHDVSDVVITFTDRWSGLNGIVTNNSRNPDPAALVVIFPTDRQLWTGYGVNPRRVRSTRAGPAGDYRFSSLPAGSYFVAAIPDEEADGWRDPEALERLSRSARTVSIAEGQTRREDLRTVPNR